MPEDYAKKLQSLLRRLFQFESADLDFGIYRIMNRKRDVIEKFIEKDLIASVDTEFGKISATTKASAKKELDELKSAIEKTLGSSAILPSGEFNPQFSNTPIGADLAKQYKEKTAAYAAASVSDELKTEVFNHIYQFFSRYYDNGDFMSMRRYSARQKFAVPYNGEEVMLHWANKDQYYIKTGEYFFNYAFRVGEYTIRFQIVQAETSMNNTKTENRFFILNTDERNITYDEKTKELVILFEYRALTESEKAAAGIRNIQDALNEQAKTAILAAIPDIGLRAGLTRETDGKTPLEKHLATYAKRNTTDYFIHKDLSGFLTQELDFYIKNEMFDLDDLGTDKEIPIEQYLSRVRVMKVISEKIIMFLAQIEDFQKKLFEKKKFVLNANYCMTLDQVPEGFYPEIVKNTAQIAEWKALYGIGEPGGQATLSSKKGNVIDEEFLKAHPHLVLDTKFFPHTFKDTLLATFDELDEVTGGLMVKSENWQALNLLQERYREQVKCIYIDPPYNTGKDEFLYKDNYQHSSWLAMIENKLRFSYLLLDSQNGFFISSIGDQELYRMSNLLNVFFLEENHASTFIWKTEGNIDNQSKIKQNHEYLISYAKNLKTLSHPKTIDPNIQKTSKLFKDTIENTIVKNGPGNPPSDIILPIGFPADFEEGIIEPGKVEWPKFSDKVKVKNWRLINPLKIRSGWSSLNFILEFIENNFNPISDAKGQKTKFLISKNGTPYVVKERLEIQSHVLSVLENMGSTQRMSSILLSMGFVFDYPKPIELIQYLIAGFSENNSTICDFFAGSGTTAHAVLNLNHTDNGDRKYILVEMAGYFDTVMKPRLQKVMYSSEWKDGRPQNTDGISHIFKYLKLEQYEDTLNNIDFMEGGTVQKTLMDMDGYMLRYMLDFETRESPCRMNTTKLERPFEYTLRITKDSEMHDETVDLVETFNYLLGLKVKRVRTFAENGTMYRVVHGETLSGQGTTVIWRTSAGLDLKADKTFIEEKILTDPKLKAERVFINGDFHVEVALPIEPEFQRLMGA